MLRITSMAEFVISDAEKALGTFCGFPKGRDGIICGFAPDHDGVHSWEQSDMVNHPPHYMSSPSGVECIDVTEWMTFNQGNAVKYLWRLFDKGDPIENLRKAIWYCEREISRLKKAGNGH